MYLLFICKICIASCFNRWPSGVNHCFDMALCSTTWFHFRNRVKDLLCIPVYRMQSSKRNSFERLLSSHSLDLSLYSYSTPKSPGAIVVQQVYSSNSEYPSKRQLVRHQKSKLDLIDDTKLTSLPFPPPPPSRSRLRRKVLSPLTCPTQTSQLSKEFIDLSDSYISTANDAFTTVDETIADISQCSDILDDDHQDPIILVEDYLSSQAIDCNKRANLLRKESLANFKKNFMKRNERPTRLRYDLEFDPLHNPSQDSHKRENLEDIFGKLPGSDKLKYCVLCDKPLYELSSILTSAEKSIRKNGPSNERKLFQELVCSDCIEFYEMISNEVQDILNGLEPEAKTQHGFNRFHETRKDSITDLLNALKYERNTESTKERQSKSENNAQFSKDLLGRLHTLNNLSESMKKKENWFPRIRSKVNWDNLQRLLFSSENDNIRK